MNILVFSRYLLNDLRHDLRHSLLTIAGLSIMVLSYLLTASLAEAFHEFGSQPQIASQNLILLSADTIDPMQGSVSQAALDQAVQAVQTTFGKDSVFNVAPTILRTLRIQAGSTVRSMQVFGVEPKGMTDVYKLALIEGRYPVGLAEIAASEEAFGLAGWQVGQTIEFYGQEFSLVGKVRYEVGKIASLWMTYAAGENLFGTQRGFQVAAIQISGSLDPETVRAYLETVPGILPTYAVYREEEVHDRLAQSIEGILKFTIVMDTLALGVITFGIFSATSLTLAERSREIGLLRVVGFATHSIRRFLFGRTLLQTLISFLLGWGLAEWAIRGQMDSSFSMHGAYIKINLSPENLLLGLTLTVLFAWLGVWLTTYSQGRQSLVALLTN